MLTLNTRIISLNIIRNYARKPTKLKKKLANPGIQKRINILNERNEKNLETVDVEELESDFMRIGELHKEHEKEINFYRDKEKYWIVKQKYFKENQINFLTWNDKEQIRYLHQTNPTEWTIEKLSEGFPALPNTISKIIKNKWNKNNTKIDNHDKAVEQNWKLLKEGKLNDLPEDLMKHLLKFTSRKPNKHNLKQQEQKINITPPKMGEFSSIIDSYQKLKTKSNKIEKPKEIVENVEDKLINENSSPYENHMIPLSYIKKSEIQMENTETQVPIDLEKLFHGDVKQNKYLTKSNEFASNTTKKSLVVQYPERITIPKDKYKKGFTYKVNDCYYDDDGLFLYRVPGMY